MREPEQAGLAADLGTRIGEATRQLIEARQLAGAVTAVARGDAVVHLQAHGTMDIARGAPTAPDTIFRIYSMTKAVGAVAAMMLCEEGRLDAGCAGRRLPAGARPYAGLQRGCPRRPRSGPGAARRAMTVRDLLRHTSGLPGNVAVNDRFRETGLPPLAECTLEEICDHLDRVALLYHPGSRWYYSVAADVVGRLVEVASGQTFDEFLEQRIFAPLGMVDTGFFCPPRQGRPAGRDVRPRPGRRHHAGGRAAGRHRVRLQLPGTPALPVLRRRPGLHRCPTTCASA